MTKHTKSALSASRSRTPLNAAIPWTKAFIESVYPDKHRARQGYCGIGKNPVTGNLLPFVKEPLPAPDYAYTSD